MPTLSMKDRYGFNVRAFVEQHGLDGSKGGAHMFREIWDPVVSSIYENTLGMYMHHLVLLLLTCHFPSLVFRTGRAKIRQTEERGSLCWPRKAIRIVV